MGQLAFAIEEEVDSIPCSRTESGKRVYEKWRMLEKLESMQGQTFLFFTNDQMVQVPILIGDMYFSSPSINNKCVDIFKIEHEQTGSLLHFSNILECLIENDDNQLSFEYWKRDWSTVNKKGKNRTHPIIQHIPSQFYLEKENYMLEKVHFPKLISEEDVVYHPVDLQGLVGFTFKAEIHFPSDDMLWKIKTLPFTISSISKTGTTLTVLGTNDVCIQFPGFVNARLSTNHVMLGGRSNDNRYYGIKLEG